MTSFIFVRHGKSQANTNDTVSDPSTPLTKEGRAQARKAARSLKAAGITKIISSPLGRAKETAGIIAKQLGVKDIEVIDALRERDMGELEGKPKEHDSLWYFTVDGQDGVEPLNDVLARCHEALQEIAASSKEGMVLVVGHAMVGFYLRQAAAGKHSVQECDPPAESANAAVVEVNITSPSHPRTPAALMPAQAALLGGSLLLVLFALLAWMLWPPNEATPPAPTGTSGPIPMSIDDFKESPNLQGAVEKQLNNQQGTNSLQQQTQSPLQQTAPGLQSPQ